MRDVTLTDEEFGRFQRFIFDAAGIHLSASKKALVSGRLARRLQHHGMPSYGRYLQLLQSGHAPAEVQTAVDLLTTNETYFFREPRHFELLRELAARHAAGAGQAPFRVWSAACSSGEEPYSIAMVLADATKGTDGWEVLGSDISTRMLQKARRAHYPMERARHVTPDHLRRFCLRGHGPQEGTLLVQRSLRERLRFAQINLHAELPPLGSFDVVFLRNVMIYFDTDTKREVLRRVLSVLRSGGHLCVGHSETLNNLTTAVTSVAPSIYRKDASW